MVYYWCWYWVCNSSHSIWFLIRAILCREIVHCLGMNFDCKSVNLCVNTFSTCCQVISLLSPYLAVAELHVLVCCLQQCIHVFTIAYDKIRSVHFFRKKTDACRMIQQRHPDRHYFHLHRVMQ